MFKIIVFARLGGILGENERGEEQECHEEKKARFHNALLKWTTFSVSHCSK